MLRDYQLKAVELVRMNAHNRPLLRLDTGAGKTTVAAELIRRAVAKGKRCVFLVHRLELVDQAVDRFAQFDLKAGRILAGHTEHRERLIQVASIPTLLRREHWPADVVIVDECAHAVSESWSTVINRYIWPTVVIGLTATPVRLDGRGLGDLFNCIIDPITIRDLIDRGYLVDPRVFAPPVDLSDVKLRAGEYDLPEVARRMGGLTGSITKTWLERASGMSTVAFAINTDHSRAIVKAFQGIGVAAAHVDYRMGRKERSGALRALRDGKLTLISQVQLLSEGWDLPSLQCAILARPTKSLALFRQMVGRVMRPPGPVLVLDHAGNHHEHGRVTDPVEWCLDGPPKREPVPSVRTCKKCFAVWSPPPRDCPVCGWAPPPGEIAPPLVDAPGELIELGPTNPKRVPMDEKRVVYAQLVAEASGKKRKLGWARVRYKERFGVWPKGMSDLERSYVCPGHEYATVELAFGPVTRCSMCYARAPLVKP